MGQVHVPGTVSGFGDSFLNWRGAAPDHGLDHFTGCVLILNYVLIIFVRRAWALLGRV